MLHKLKLLGYLFFVSVVVTSAFAQTPFLRNPAVSPDGKTLAFVYQGDIWTMPLAGGSARRLTIHQAYDASPVWSPDGKQIAFSSDRFGNNDIFVIDANGSMPRRITYYSNSDNVSSWSDAYGLLFESSRAFKQIERDSELMSVSADGGTPVRAFTSLGFEPIPSPNGRLVAFARGWARTAREAYHGSANRDIWIWDSKTDQYNQITTYDGPDMNPKWADDNTLVYISASPGKYNLFKVGITADGKATGAPQPLTQFKDYGVMSMDVNGGVIAFEQFNKLYTLPVSGGAPKELKVDLGADYRFDPIEHKTYSDHLSDYAVSPNGKLILLEVRGELFVSENDKEKSRTNQVTDNPYRDEDGAWLNDSTVLFTSDRDGKFDLFMARSSDPSETSIFKTLKIERKKIFSDKEDIHNPVVSPDGEKVAYRVGRGKLVVSSIDKDGKLSKAVTLLDGWATPSGVSWSPDSKWLAYSLDDLDFNEEVYIHAADNSKPPVNVTMHPKNDYDPFWSKDGSKLGFLSQRNNGDADVWFVWLKKSDWEKTKQDWDEQDEPKKDNGKGKDKDKKVPDVQIDFDKIYQRLSQVTSLPGNESDVNISDDGEYFFYVTNRPGRSSYKADRDLYKIKWDGTKPKELTSGNTEPSGVRLSPDGKSLYYVKRGKLSVVDADKGKPEARPFMAKMDVNHTLERTQIFEEAWRTLDAGFYDPGFHGQNFDLLKKKYKDWAISASTETDFQYVFNLMLGQLNASHMGLYGSDRQETQNERTGFLGVDIAPQKDGVKITRVVPNGPADRENSNLVVGDMITSINGDKVSATDNMYAPLVNKAGEKVILEVKSPSGSTREVVIRPTNSLRNLLYEEWVEDRRALVDKYSNGQLGYIHIQGMNWTSFEEFERELTASGQGKKGLVIDVRYNGGGWTTDYLMAVLDVRQHAYTIPRGATDDLAKHNKEFRQYYPYGERLPLAAWTKPAIAMCNENSYSNAEIFSHAFKTLNRGKLVGTPTFGAVISTGGQGLIDGSYVRLPFRAWYVLATGKSMENIPAVPDIVLDNAPDSKAKGEDEQLKKAVETLMGEIK
ncbi:MAG: PD40 domain-containing protein [Cyclobacteriaceae bacterium]|nr:PD40 domain-containing protein [Cyclobacteriaceae bacterium]